MLNVEETPAPKPLLPNPITYQLKLVKAEANLKTPDSSSEPSAAESEKTWEQFKLTDDPSGLFTKTELKFMYRRHLYMATYERCGGKGYMPEPHIETIEEKVAKLDPQEVQRLKDLWNSMDLNKDGAVDWQELNKAVGSQNQEDRTLAPGWRDDFLQMGERGEKIPYSNARQMVSCMDSNQDGVLSAQELIVAVVTGTLPEKLK